MAQIQKGETFTDTAPDYEVTSTRLNNHVAGAILLPGAISEQTLVTSTAAADLAIINQGGALKSVALSNFNGVGAVSATQLVEANRQGVHQYAVGALSAAVYAVTLAPAATAYTAGMKIQFKADSANLGAVDVNVNALGAKNLFYNVSEELPADFIRASQVVEAVYDGTNFQVTSLGWKGLFGALPAETITVPAALTTPATDDLALVSDTTASGALRRVTLANLLPTFTSTVTALNTLAAGKNLDEAHGLGGMPVFVRGVLVCTSTDQGYAAGDEIDFCNVGYNAGGYIANGIGASASATNVWATQSVASTGLIVRHKTTGAYVSSTIDQTKWSMKIYARR